MRPGRTVSWVDNDAGDLFTSAGDPARAVRAAARDVHRFQRYIATLTGSSDDVVLPIGAANPMAKEHAVVKIDDLLAIGADEVRAQAAAGAGARLKQVTA